MPGGERDAISRGRFSPRPRGLGEVDEVQDQIFGTKPLKGGMVGVFYGEVHWEHLLFVPNTYLSTVFSKMFRMFVIITISELAGPGVMTLS